MTSNFPFYYSGLNAALARSSVADTMGIFASQIQEKMNTNAMMYWTPMFNPNITLQFPQFGWYGNYLLDPMLAVQQTLQAFNNNSWNQMSWANNNNWFPWGNNNGNNGGSNGGNTSGATTAQTNEYNSLKALLEKYKELNPKDKASADITDALNKSGTTVEKLNTLKEVYKKLTPEKIEKALLDIPEHKIMLDAAGYNFNGTNKDDDASLKNDLTSLETALKASKGDKLVYEFPTESDKDILRKISYWNDSDTRNTDTTRSVIRMIANNIPSADSELECFKKGVNNLVLSLIAKGEELKSAIEGETSSLDKASNELKNALGTAQKDGGFTKDNLMKVAEKFDTLYQILRIMDAQRVRNEIIQSYGFLNNISKDDTDVLTDDLVVKATKEDLAKEGFTSIPQVDELAAPEIEESEGTENIGGDSPEPPKNWGDTVDEQIENLKKEVIEDAGCEGYYQNKNASQNEPNHIYTVQNGKIVELVDVKAISADGTKCTMVDGTEKAVSEVKTKPVTPDEISQYADTIDLVDKLVKDGSIKKISNFRSDTIWPKGVQLYRSKGLQSNGQNQYFVVRNNKLVRIKAYYVRADGQITMQKDDPDRKLKTYNQLEESDFENISEGKILKEDEVDEKPETPAHTEETSETSETTTSNEKQEEWKNLDKPQADVDFDALFDGDEDELIKNEDYKIGKDIADKLMWHWMPWNGWGTSDEAWRSVQNIIERDVNVDNIYRVIKTYNSKEGVGTDRILEQIAREGFSDDDGKQAKAKMNRKIIECVVEYCKKNGAADYSAAQELADALKLHSENDTKYYDDDSKMRKLDKEILFALGIL